MTPIPLDSSHPGTLELEDLLWARDGGFDAEGARTGGGPGLAAGAPDLRRVAEHFDGCPDCRRQLQQLQEQRAAFDAELPAFLRPGAGPSVDSGPVVPLRRSPAGARWAPLAIAAAVVMAVLWVQPPPPDLLPKGGEHLALTTDAGEAWDAASPASAVTLEATLTEPAHVVVVGIQDDGVRSLLVRPQTLGPGAAVLGRATLDGYPGGEVAELWARPDPWTDAAVAALLAGRTDGARRLATAELRAR